MAPRHKQSHPKASTKPCNCPVCDIADQFGLPYLREHCNKGTAVIPYLPPIALNPDGTVCELPTMDPCDAIEKGFRTSNRLGGHVILPKWIFNCRPAAMSEYPTKANGDDKPFFRVFCTNGGDLIAPRDFIEPELVADTSPTNVLKHRVLKVLPGTCQAVTNVGFHPPPILPGNAEKVSPVYFNPANCRLVVAQTEKVCGVALGSATTGEADNDQVNKPISGGDGEETPHPDLVCLEATYTNNSNCQVRVEFQSSQSMTIEIEPNSFFQVGHDIQGDFPAGASQTPGFFNKSDHPVCMTFTTLHNNCVCLNPGQSRTYKSVPLTRSKNNGSVGTIISYQARSRVCWETV